jgi:hypothetical protein
MIAPFVNLEIAMTSFTVRRGRRYRARISLGLFEQLAGNQVIAEKLRSAGFADVSVTGSGATRVAEASWVKDDASAALPSQVTEVDEIA